MPVSKSRRKSGKKAAKPRAPRSRSDPQDETLLPDGANLPRKQLNELFEILQQAEALDESLDGDADDALFAAQELVYDAWEVDTKRQRVALAKAALEISELCADAWMLLAQETAKTSIEQRDYLQKALDAGEAAVRQTLGPNVFEEEAGHFWGILETRPYMRARAALAESLWNTGERPDAIAHWREMLRLCPNDNLGIRYILAQKLLYLGEIEAVASLLETYREPDFAEWSYTYALLKFKQNGATSGADKALRAALKSNPHVAPYLLGTKRLPANIPDHYRLGSKEEALIYVMNAIDSWTSTSGALQWLHDVVDGTK